MIKARFNTRDFTRKMNNIVDYSLGFISGVEKGKPIFLKVLGEQVSDMVGLYIDASARSRPEFLHHVYEWYETGDANSRLFKITFVVTKNNINFNSNFIQSQSIKSGSKEPFYNKAEIMENGMSITIAPKQSPVLVFDVNGDTVFTPNEVVVDNPGGNTQGEYANIFDQFFNKYFTQAFLKSSGLAKHLSTPTEFKTNLSKGAKSGKPSGIAAGFKWITSSKIGVE